MKLTSGCVGLGLTLSATVLGACSSSPAPKPPVPLATIASTPATTDAVPVDVQGRYDGVLSAALAARTRSPRLPAGPLFLLVMASGGVGVLDFANNHVYITGLHAQGSHQVVATVTPPQQPANFAPGPQVPMGCSGPGTYRWSYQLVHANLRFNLVSDSCADRKVLLGLVRWHAHGAPK